MSEPLHGRVCLWGHVYISVESADGEVSLCVWGHLLLGWSSKDSLG